MIYLIDDSDLKELNAEYVFDDKYKDILCVVRDASQFEKQIPLIYNAECIMIHASFENSITYKTRVLALAIDKDIPFVSFSGDDYEFVVFSEQSNPNYVRGIKKGIFYHRLRSFLDFFKQKNEINLMILAYGENYNSYIARKCALVIFRKTSGMSGTISEIDLAKITTEGYFKKLIDLAEPAIGISYDNLIDDLLNNPITIVEFLSHINKIVESFCQFGVNIYTWK